MVIFTEVTKFGRKDQTFLGKDHDFSILLIAENDGSVEYVVES
ncbi:hypothetical protein V6Z11_D11G198600 [Gossypium hirsutum]